MREFFERIAAFCCISKNKTPPAPSPPPEFMTQSYKVQFNYKPGRVLFSEGAVEVLQGISPKGELIIVKKLKLRKDPDIVGICSVLKALIQRTLDWNHPNLVRYLGAEYNPDTGEFLIFTESVSSDYDSMAKFITEESHIRFLMRQIFIAVRFLHEKGLRLIGNIKPSNLLIDSNGLIKIRDFIGSEYFKTLRKVGGLACSESVSFKNGPGSRFPSKFCVRGWIRIHF